MQVQHISKNSTPTSYYIITGVHQAPCRGPFNFKASIVSAVVQRLLLFIYGKGVPKDTHKCCAHAQLRFLVYQNSIGCCPETPFAGKSVGVGPRIPISCFKPLNWNQVPAYTPGG